MFHRMRVLKVSQKTQESVCGGVFFHKVTKIDSTSATSNERVLQRVTSDFL